MPGVFSGILSDAFWPLRIRGWLSAIDFVAYEHTEIVPGLAANPKIWSLNDSSATVSFCICLLERALWTSQSARLRCEVRYFRGPDRPLHLYVVHNPVNAWNVSTAAEADMPFIEGRNSSQDSDRAVLNPEVEPSQRSHRHTALPQQVRDATFDVPRAFVGRLHWQV